jgi:hypothetical protein
MNHPLIIKGYESNKEALHYIKNLDSLDFSTFVYYLANAVNNRAIQDENKGYVQLSRLGYELNNILLKQVKCSYPNNELKKLAENVEVLRYDALEDVISNIPILKPVQIIVHKMWKIAEKHLS